MAGELISDRPADGVLRLAISNPAKRNALDQAILDALTDELQSLEDVRCVILTGRSGMFSSGYDISEIPVELFSQEAEKLVAHPFCDALAALDDAEIPTLAALSGATIGGGLELALACDLRLACDHIKLGMPPARLGLVYSHTGLRRFVNAIGARASSSCSDATSTPRPRWAGAS
jgi:enoyl-CoA hydratase/carnithine racemase